ncbi:MAG TPA: UDP-glucuronic acid decarboxylase family protein [Bacillota bacterium]|nr:UDP-glucuronic acid decarboxylase family protein [Bacillota bacterium]
MKIIITGVAGFIGSNLAKKLLRNGCQVIGFDNFITGNRDNLKALQQSENFSFYEHDVIYPIHNLIGDQEIDWIMHFASPASPKKYLKFPIETLRVNCEGTYQLLELARQKKARFFFTSTSEVYGDAKVYPQPENYWGNVNPNGPRSVYDEAKRYAESLTLAYHEVNQVSTRLIRIFNTYGPNMDLADGRVVINFVIQALKNQPITIYGDGTQTRSFQYIDDLIAGILRFMEVEFYQPINIGNTEEYSILEIAEIIKELTGSRSDILFCPLPTDDPYRRKPDISLAKEVLKWEPQVSLQEGLSKIISWVKTVMSN